MTEKRLETVFYRFKRIAGMELTTLTECEKHIRQPKHDGEKQEKKADRDQAKQGLVQGAVIIHPGGFIHEQGNDYSACHG